MVFCRHEKRTLNSTRHKARCKSAGQHTHTHIFTAEERMDGQFLKFTRIGKKEINLLPFFLWSLGLWSRAKFTY